MLREIYLLLKAHLTTNVAALKHINLGLNQAAQLGEDYVPITPEALLSFEPIEWTVLPGNIQRAILKFNVSLVSETVYGDERDITDQTYTNHLGIESSIYSALSYQRFLLSDLAGNGALAGTDNDRLMIESIVRITTEPHSEISDLIITTQQFQCTIFDYAAQASMQEVLATLNCTTTLHQTL